MDKPYMAQECKPATMDKPYMTQGCKPATMDLPYMRQGCALSIMDIPYMDIESTSSSNSVGVAISRRRYTQSDNTLLPIPIHFPAAGNAYG